MRKLCCCALLLAVGCSGPKQPAVEDLAKHESLPQFKLGTLRGTRDGDRLAVQAMFTDSSSILTMDMHFAVGSPTTLESGAWRWTRNNVLMTGTMAAREVMFLGGQDGPPSVGGTFDLLGPDGAALYRVTLPVTQLQARLRPAATLGGDGSSVAASRAVKLRRIAPTAGSRGTSRESDRTRFAAR